MRRLKRNQRVFTYETIQGTQAQTDTQGYKTGRKEVQYNDPVSAQGCIVFKGSSDYKAYGIEEDWSIQIVPDNPIDDITVGTRITVDNKQYYVLSHPRTMNEQKIYAK